MGVQGLLGLERDTGLLLHRLVVLWASKCPVLVDANVDPFIVFRDVMLTNPLNNLRWQRMTKNLSPARETVRRESEAMNRYMFERLIVSSHVENLSES